MPTFNRTFRVVTGIDVANTVVLDANRNLSNITSINASTFVTSSGLDVTGQANTATTVAQNAYGAANNRVLKAGDTMTGQLNISSGGLIVTGGDVGIGTASPIYKLEVNGSFAATTKSFVIKHPTKSNHKLRYGSLEGPENGVYVRGKLENYNIINLPDYWAKLVDPSSITVSLTPIGKHQKLFVDAIIGNQVIIGNQNFFGKINCFYVVYGERIDVDKLVTEYPTGE